ncbi:MAG TPA: isoprenoid biosynthesis glyoxalase ElbB [Candidatus Sumerlaeota bacterium]|mgnify:CR=1 FL=1|nr:MAG: Enhancing lycopene biosynthesis protein 2 [candidate division BRC1 bacterium ADurb.BinA292]HPK03274.1 isoprenoid biosynthesis glyoxalase ElbB [Candidatus Sumerlaeota bacterium]
MKTVGVCLSGCGYLDGAEIQEAVLTLLAIDQAGARAYCFAPDKEQSDVIDHLTETAMPGKVRNVLTESARIARGKIENLDRVHAADLDALVFPGGYGAAKNLCTFAAEGAECRVDPEVERLVREVVDTRRPIAAICIAPVIVARVLGQLGLHPRLTLGTDAGLLAALEAMGAEPVQCGVTECVEDEPFRIVSTPAYLLGQGPGEVYQGIRGAIERLLAMTG